MQKKKKKGFWGVHMYPQSINRSLLCACTMIMGEGERPAHQNISSSRQQMLGPEAAEEQQQWGLPLAQWPRALSVSQSGVGLYACVHTFTYAPPSLHTHRNTHTRTPTHMCTNANTITPPTLHWWHFIKIALPSSLCFPQVVSQNTHTHTHTRMRAHTLFPYHWTVPYDCHIQRALCFCTEYL